MSRIGHERDARGHSREGDEKVPGNLKGLAATAWCRWELDEIQTTSDSASFEWLSFALRSVLVSPYQATF